jgi:hypothetical protein
MFAGGCGDEAGVVEVVPQEFVVVAGPSAGAEWVPGAKVTIAWASAGPDQLDVQLSRDNGANWENISTAVDAATTSVSWTVTDGGDPLPQNNCVVRVVDAADGSPEGRSAGFSIRGSTIIHVDAAVALGGDGASWATAFQHPQDAADAAHPGDRIWVKSGTYTGLGSGAVLQLTEGVEVYGGFAGTEEVPADRAAGHEDTCILDGEDLYRVVEGARNVTLDGLTITAGSGDYGAGMRFDNCGSVTLVNCVVDQNTATAAGGGVYALNTNLTLTSCDFTTNSAPGGGGVDMTAPDKTGDRILASTDSSFAGNQATGSSGGGLKLMRTNASFTGGTFASNTAALGNGGGAQGIDALDVSFSGVVFTSNTANAATGYGGGMYISSDSVVLDACTFTSCSGGAGGGAYLNSDRMDVLSSLFDGCSASSEDGGGLFLYDNYFGYSSVRKCRFRSCTAARYGGGLRATLYSALSVINSVFYQNQAGDGGGMYILPGGLDVGILVANCSLNGNVGTGGGGPLGFGGGINVTTGGGGTVNVVNSIIYGNTANFATSNAIYSSPSVDCTVANSCVDVSAGGYYIDGGSNLTVGTDPLFVVSDQDLHLQATSPCIDLARWFAAAGGGITEDIDGETRPVDIAGVGNAGPGDIYDMGAHEVQ